VSPLAERIVLQTVLPPLYGHLGAPRLPDVQSNSTLWWMPDRLVARYYVVVGARFNTFHKNEKKFGAPLERVSFLIALQDAPPLAQRGRKQNGLRAWPCSIFEVLTGSCAMPR